VKPAGSRGSSFFGLDRTLAKRNNASWQRKMCRNLEGSHVIKEGKKRSRCVFKNHVLATDFKEASI